MPYPSRGAWLFRNVKADFSFRPRLGSIEITQEWPDVVATLACEVTDLGEGHTFTEEDEVRAIFREDRVFAGHLKTVTEISTSPTGPRIWRLEAQDYTAKLGDAIIRQREHRQGESALRRIRWILSYLDSAWHLDGRDLDIPDEQVEREDMYGMSVAEALDSISNEMGLRYWVDLDNTLHVVDSAHTVPAPFSLDNEAPDYIDTFPFWDWEYRRDSVDLANAVLVEPERREDSRWSVAQANIDNYAWGDSTGRQELFVSAEEIRTARAAERKGDAVLQRRKVVESEATLTLYEPGIWAGHSVQIREALWDHDRTMRVIRVEIRAVDPHDADGTAYLKSSLTLNNKPKRRSPKMGRPEVPGTATNTTPRPIDPFNSPVAPPTMVEGGAILAPVSTLEVKAIALGTPPGDPAVSVGPAALEEVASWVGATQYPYPGAPFCAGMPGFGGWQEQERWYHFTVPAHPGSMAGIRITLSTGAGASPADAGAEVVVSASPPTGLRQGSVVGTVPHGGSADIIIPGGLVPNAGGVVYIGMRPKWQADYGGVACGWNWPFVYGWLNSARLPVAAGSIVWMTWSVTGGSMGTIAEDPDAPWQGGNDWQEAGIEGSPVYGVDDEGYYVEASSPSGRGIMVQGPEEDEAQPPGPWVGRWSYRFEFMADVLGDTADPGTRSIEVVTVGTGQRTIGTVHLGDAARDPGLSVGAPTDADYEEAPITAGDWWAARFDSRSGEMRGKVWLVADGEPASWDVSVPLSEVEASGDRFELWLRAGNDGGSQRVTVRRLMAQAVAPEGTEVMAEFAGFASGGTNGFPCDHRYRPASIVALVNGVTVKPTREYGAEARYLLDAYPTGDSIIAATYTVETGD